MSIARKIALMIPNLRAFYEDKQRLEYEYVNVQKQLGSRIQSIEAENQYLYSGCAALTEQINLLEYRISNLVDLHDDVVLRKWQGEKHEQICLMPFTDVEILPDGSVYTCCSGFVKQGHSIGNVYEQSLGEMWNSDKARKLRYSVSMGGYEYCNRFCTYFMGIEKDSNKGIKRDSGRYVYENWTECVVDFFPKRISLTCDETTCNLSCASCRTSVKGNSQETNDKIYNMLMCIPS